MSKKKKGATDWIKMNSTESGYFFVQKKNTRTETEKRELRKYDPNVRKHVLFKEGKMK